MTERKAATETAAPAEPAADARAAATPPATAAERMLMLQRTAGNRAAARVAAEERIARRPTQVRGTFSEPRTGSLGSFEGRTAFEVDFAPLQATITVKVRLVPDANVAAGAVDQVKLDAADNFARLWDEQFILTDEASHESYLLKARVVFVDSGGHLRVRLKAGDGPIDQTTWHVQDLGIEYAHEISHTLGLFDEYIDPTAVRRRTATSPGVFQDHSVMGNYFNEGIAQAEVKLRHGQRLAATIGRATRRRFTAAFSGYAQGARLVRWRGIRDAATLGTPARAAAAAEVEAIERDMLFPEISAAAGETYVPTP
jgi:hypothetical protein